MCFDGIWYLESFITFIKFYFDPDLTTWTYKYGLSKRLYYLRMVSVLTETCGGMNK